MKDNGEEDQNIINGEIPKISRHNYKTRIKITAEKNIIKDWTEPN
jgi:hypothetical protein